MIRCIDVDIHPVTVCLGLCLTPSLILVSPFHKLQLLHHILISFFFYEILYASFVFVLLCFALLFFFAKKPLLKGRILKRLFVFVRRSLERRCAVKGMGWQSGCAPCAKKGNQTDLPYLYISPNNTACFHRVSTGCWIL